MELKTEKTGATLEEVQQRLKREGIQGKVQTILEIEFEGVGRRYMAIVTSPQMFASGIEKHGVTNIVRVYGSHPVLSDEDRAADDAEIAREAREDLRNDTHCAGCLTKIDGTMAYNQMEWMRCGDGGEVRVRTYYCESCVTVLGAVGGGELSALEAWRTDVGGPELETKGD